MLLKDKIHPVAVLEAAIIVSQKFLSQFAENEDFSEKIISIFGSSFDAEKLSYFRQSWLNSDFETLPEIEIRSQEDLGGANGAFTASTNKIYLSEEYIAHNSFNSGAIVDVLLEEIGHSVDANINQLDTVGDEGEIFSAVVQKVELDETTVQAWKNEDDIGFIYLDNTRVQIEQQNEKISLSSFLDQTEALLKEIQSSINEQVFSGDNVPNIGNLDGLPLFGDSLQNNDETKFLEDLSKEIREKLTDRFGGVDNVSPQNIQEALSDIFGSNSPITQEGSKIIFDFNINREKIFQTTLPNDIGLPQLDLSYEPNPTASVNLNYIIDSGIGIDLATSEFFFDISSDKDISISLKPSLPKNTEARMGFLLVDAKDIGSQLDLDIDLKGAEDHITLDDIENIEALPEGDASVNLNLQSTADISNIDSLNSLPTIRKLPQLGTDLKINWNFEENGFAPTVKFENLTVEVGSLIVDLLRPIIKEVRNITEPFGKIYGFLKTEIPILNKLGFSNATLLGLANNSADLPGLASLTDLGIAGIDLIGQVDELIGSLGNTIDNLEDLKFDIGDVSLGEFDLRNIFSNFDEAEIEDSRNQALQTLVDSIPLSSDYDDYRKFFDTFLDDQLKQILSLPILENPETIAKLFLGQAFENVTSGERVKFLEFKLPQINTKLETTDRFSFPGLPVKFGFGGSIDVNILPTKLSYDSLGLEKWASKEIDFDPNQASVLFDGLLVDDNRDNGVDKPEAKIDGRIFATSPEIGIPFILGVGIDGGIKASIFADIEDLGEVGNDLGDSDGQIRGSEILAIARVNPDCLIELGGQIDAFLGGYIRYFFKKKRKDLVSIKLGDFDISSCPGHKPTLANEGPENFDGGILELNIGPQASKRLVVSTTDNDETFFVTGNGSKNNETVRVIAFGYSQSFSGVNQILANAGESDDSIEVENIAIPVEFSGGNGNDRLFGGNSNDFLSGDAGNDKLFGKSGNDLLLGSDGNDLIFAGDGNDSVSGGSNSDVLNLLLPGDELFGEGGADTIDGGAGSDYIDGGIGNDTLFGDTDDTQLGNDTIFGDDGKDKIYGFRGNDVLVGGNGSDLIYGGSGNDKLVGDLDEEDNGNDFLRGDAGNDEISGSNGNDTVIYDTSPNGVVVNIDEKQNYTSFAIEPDFTVNASEAKDGFGFTDSFQVAIIVDSNLDENGQIFDLETRNISGNLENIIASQQDDILIGNSSDNKIEALEGNDLLIGNTGSDTLDGGNGNDTVSYRRETNKVNVNLETEIATEFSGDTDTLISIENVIGSAGDDEIIGDQNSNIIFGEEGKDSLQGKQGDDKLIGGKDGDVIDGGEGNDTASYFTATDGVTANLTNSQENTGDAQGDSFQSIENLEGSEFGDRLFADVQNNDIQGLGGDDYLDGLTGDDTMSGGTGNDTYKVESVNDIVIENIDQGIDTVDAAIDYILGANLENLNLLEGTAALNGTGNELNNIINGNSGDNVIFGGDGDDSITGGLGNESSVSGSLGKINGTPGSDILTGGNGNDAFIYNNIADTGDLITDFTVGDDKIVVTELLQSLGYAGSDPITDGLLGFKQASDSLAVLQIDPDGAASDMFNPMPFILLDNVSIAALNDSGNFVF